MQDAVPTPEAIQAWILARVVGLYEQREHFAARPASRTATIRSRVR